MICRSTFFAIPRLCLTLSLFATLVLCLPSPLLRADGAGDNDPTTVRRVPKAGVEVPADRAAALQTALTTLQDKLHTLHQAKDETTQSLVPDVMIFERAVRVALEHDEFFSPQDINKADTLVQLGIDRADQLIKGQAHWIDQSGQVVRGYISRIDQTVQPYGLIVPETYAFNHSVPTRCDLWFHGRGETLSELNFLWDRVHNPGYYSPDHTIVLHPYGRYSNAFKFAGETDVLEALEDVQQRYRIDEDRISVRGFSMGGAACWQFAVHYPDRWFAANPGAGFSETPQFLKFFQKETLNPQPWEKALWNLYDCDKYALNLKHCPTIAYSGEDDIQKQAADVMEAALKKHRIRLRHLIGAKMGHKIDGPSKAIIEAGMTAIAKNGRNTVPHTIAFETYTLKYNRLHWLQINALDEHWQRAAVRAVVHPPRHSGRYESDDAARVGSLPVAANGPGVLDIHATNVRDVTIRFAPGDCPIDVTNAGVMIHDQESSQRQRILIDGPQSDRSWTFRLRRNDKGIWRVAPPQTDVVAKRHNLQGPIDDAFMDSFVFVRPTGNAAHEAVGQWATAELDRAIEHWRRHFRGDARVVNDTDVTDALIQSANLVLWGDPSSNSVMQNIADRLPLRWTDQQITVGERTYAATNHAPILIYPNPLNPDRYVVLNSSFTFRDYAYLNNARQVPMLPDWAIVNLKTPPGNVWPGEVVAADFFDEQWQLKK